MGLRDEAAENFVKLGFAERFLHLDNAEQFLFVGVVTGGDDRCGYEPLMFANRQENLAKKNLPWPSVSWQLQDLSAK